MTPGTVVGRIGLASAVPVVHAVTNDEIVARKDFVDVACGVMRVLGSRGALQLRASHLPARDFVTLAEGLIAAQALTGAWVVVNDRVDAALACGAKGVQLTSYSLDVARARRIGPALALGASAHNLAEGERAIADGADWIVVRHAFSSAKPAAESPVWIRTLASATSVPVVAIGGIRVEHASVLRQFGVHGVAVIRGIWDAPNAEQAAHDYLSAYDRVGA